MKSAFILHIVLLLACIPLRIYSQPAALDVDLMSDGHKLHAQIYLPDSNQTSYTLIMCHGYPGGEGDPLGLAKALSSQGIKVLVFNYQGTWSSEGEFTFEASLQDVSHALRFLKDNENIQRFHIDTTNIIVAGYSFGGSMVLTEAIYNPEIKRIISIGGSDQSVFGNKMLSDPGFRSMFEGMIKRSVYPDGPVKVNMEVHNEYWLANLDRYNLVHHAQSLLNRDMLFIFGWNDVNVIPEEHVLPLIRELQSLDAKHIRIETLMTDHSFRNVREQIAGIIYNWIVKGQ